MTETEVRPPRTRPTPPDLDAEREVDLSGYWHTIGSRWWILVVAVVVGALLGYLASLGSGSVYRAKATIYLGQPVSPLGGGGQIQSLGSNPSTANAIAKSESTIRNAASQVGLRPGELRRGVSTGTVAGALVKQGQTPLVTISVRGPWREKTAQAANIIAGTVAKEVSAYADQKIAALNAELKAQDEEIKSTDARIQQLETALAQGNGLSDAERLSLVSVLGFAQQRRGDLVTEQTQTREILSVAQNVEKSRIVARAAATKVSARSKRSSLVIGALIGLIVGIAIALLWDPIVERRRPRLA
jgi:capsular polysaccharide biosynthesis protein